MSGRPAAFSRPCSSSAPARSGAGPTRTRYSLPPPLETADTDALKPFTRTSRASRSAFSRLLNTPSCTAQPPDSELLAVFAAAERALEGFSAAAAPEGLEASVRAAAEDVCDEGFWTADGLGGGSVDFAARDADDSRAVGCWGVGMSRCAGAAADGCDADCCGFATGGAPDD